MLNLTPKVGIERYTVLSNELYQHAMDPNACDHNLVWTYIISTKRSTTTVIIVMVGFKSI
jgi:hypothetical protein